MADLRALEAAARGLLPAGCALGSADPRQTYPLWPGEALGAAAVPKRLAEFSAGRQAARQAMASLGLPAEAILKGVDRAPIWPAALIGSISHNREACLAVVARRGRLQGLGLDLETADPLEADLAPRILFGAEPAWVAAQPDPGLAAMRVFSAKEAAYKAQYPLTRRLFDFDGLRLDFHGTGFVASFAMDCPPFKIGDQIQGVSALVEGQILSLAWITA